MTLHTCVLQEAKLEAALPGELDGAIH